MSEINPATDFATLARLPNSNFVAKQKAATVSEA
jgi:hypothetical protein